MVNPFNVLDIDPPREMQIGDPRVLSIKQQNALRNFGVPNPHSYTANEAQRLLGELFGRANNNLCTYKQMKILKRNGMATDVSKKEAGRMIDDLAKLQGWNKRNANLLALRGKR